MKALILPEIFLAVTGLGFFCAALFNFRERRDVWTSSLVGLAGFCLLHAFAGRYLATWNVMLPEIGLGIGGLFFFCGSLFQLRKHQRLWAIGFSAFAAVAAVSTMNADALFFHGAYRVDGFGRFFVLLITTGFLVACIITDRLPQTDVSKINELFFFLFTGALGLTIVVGAAELITLFIALEISSFPLYITSSYRTGLGFQFEATAKYMVFGAVSTAIMLYGISYLYGAFGTTHLQIIITDISAHLQDPLAILGIVMFMAGLSYKLSAFPFHFWAPDVYSGAAAEVTAFIASLPKLAAVALFVRVVAGFMDARALQIIIAVLAVLSMTFGNLMALNQTELKRLLAYSAVSHAGYILLGLLAPHNGGLDAALFYGAVYVVMTLGGFLIAIQVAGNENDIPLKALAGLWKKSPLLSILLALTFVSLAGLPPTAGFTGKLLLLTAVWKAGWFWPVLAALLNTLIAIYFYLRVIKISLVSDQGQKAENSLQPPLLISSAAAALGVALLLLGIFPGGLLDMAGVAVRAL